MRTGPKKDACIKVQPSQPAVPEGYWNNTCIQIGMSGNSTVPPTYATVNGCDSSGKVVDPHSLPVMHNNKIYNPFGSAQVLCASLTPPFGKISMTMEQFQMQGGDLKSTIQMTPPVAEVINLAKNILGLD